MTKHICGFAAWFLASLGGALLVIGLVLVPEGTVQGQGPEPQTCSAYCDANYPEDYDLCMAACQAAGGPAQKFCTAFDGCNRFEAPPNQALRKCRLNTTTGNCTTFDCHPLVQNTNRPDPACKDCTCNDSQQPTECKCQLP